MSARADQSLTRARQPAPHIPSRSSPRKTASPAMLPESTSKVDPRKKARSKSMGPAGLEALKSSSGNRRVSLAAPSRPPPRSILKAAGSAISEIPLYKSTVKPASTSLKATDKAIKALAGARDGSDSPLSGTRVTVRTEEEQQAASREREEREAAAMAKETMDRKEARRKSLANRRVSFAAEATLHTFHEVEYMQEAASATISKRRASAVATQSQNDPEQQLPVPAAFEPPSTPPEQKHDRVTESPASQRGQHHVKSNPSVKPLYSNSDGVKSDDVTIATSVYSSDSDAGDSVVEVQMDEASGSESESDNDGTVITVDAEEMTSASMASFMSALEQEIDTTSSLDGVLALAAQTAQENTVTAAVDEEVIANFAGWGKKFQSGRVISRQPSEPTLSDQDSSPLKDVLPDEDDASLDLDMDMTQSAGRILKPLEEDMEDVPMEETHVFGQVFPRRQTNDLSMANDLAEDGDVSMEMTMMVGGLVALDAMPAASTALCLSPSVSSQHEATMEMDMTVAVGGILNDHNVRNEDSHVQSSTTASTPRSGKKAIGKKQLSDAGRTQSGPSTTPQKSPSKAQTAILGSSGDVHTAEVDEMAAFHGKGLRRSEGPGVPVTQSMPNRRGLRDGLTPVGRRNDANTKTPSPSRHRPSSSPVRSSGPATSKPRQQSLSPRKATPTKSNVSPSRPSIFRQDPATGSAVPMILLTPTSRRLSGKGADRSGLGSPRISDILERRVSLADSASEFSPISVQQLRKAVAFEDPRDLKDSFDAEREEDEARENGRNGQAYGLDTIADGNSAPFTLQEMIQNLSPKKVMPRGRKSLHVGSARGLLGKRPQELDNEDSEEHEHLDGVKRLKGLLGSPVKSVRLQQPPSKAETTGRHASDRSEPHASMRASTRSSSPRITPQATTPRKQSYPERPGVDSTWTSITDAADLATSREEGEMESGSRRIHLQEFLNLTSIRFMELTTTKRRHTAYPSEIDNDIGAEEEDLSLEQCLATGACTIPMLELYQHSCRELKKYISEGRRIIREIETETLEENPPLFQEYMTATPDFKLLMDNQFKNVKTHARFLSKAMWYEWRMKLQDGLKEGLLRSVEGMKSDEDLLTRQQQLLDPIYAPLSQRHDLLKQELAQVEVLAAELADCDSAELSHTRSELRSLGDDVHEQEMELQRLRDEMQGIEIRTTDLSRSKVACQADIQEAEKIREECRGWSFKEISALSQRVDNLERQHGWVITRVSGSVLSLSYLEDIELVMDLLAIRKGDFAKIEVSYVGCNRSRAPVPSSLQKGFFVQSIGRHLQQKLPQQASLSFILSTVATAWDKIGGLSTQLRLLGLAWPTTVTKSSETSIQVAPVILLAPLQTKIRICMDLSPEADRGELSFKVQASAHVVYGELFNAQAMEEFLAKRLGQMRHDKAQGQAETWVDVVLDFQAKLLSGQRK